MDNNTYRLELICSIVADFYDKQTNLLRETVNLSKYIFHEIQELIKDKKIYPITTEIMIKYIKSIDGCNICFI
jgi:hypothetical protein